jgi:hypothetical protein
MEIKVVYYNSTTPWFYHVLLNFLPRLTPPELNSDNYKWLMCIGYTQHFDFAFDNNV